MSRLLLIAAALAFLLRPAIAHESLPGYLEILEEQPQTYRVFWRVPALDGVPPAIAFAPPSTCRALGETTAPLTPGSLTEQWRMRCTQPLAGQTIAIDGLDNTLLDVLVRIKFRSGAEVSHIVRPLESSFVVEHDGSGAAGYLLLGIEHILYGLDHLLFVLGLLLLVRNTRRLIKTITAFTIAHTITLSLAAFGLVRVPVPFTEAAIALSILFIATEMRRARRPAATFTQLHPWTVAFAFGLLHGFGFAGSLAKLGLAPSRIPLALLLFNCGVEAGQLAVIAVFLSFLWCVRHLEFRRPAWSEWSVSYAFGSVSAFWFIQRCVNLY